MLSPVLITSVPTSSIPILESHITSLSAAYTSALAVLATATNTVTVKSMSLQLAQISASLMVQRQEILLLTLTDSSVIASLTLQMMEYQNDLQLILNNNSPYSGMIPNFGFNLLMTIIFGILFLFHIYGLFYRQWWFSIAFLCATVLELLGYIGRVLSNSLDVENIDYFLLQFICLTLLPVFSMGGIYYQLAKLATIYGEQYSRWTPILYSYTFITCDIISLVIQAAGGGIAGVAVDEYNSPDTGTHVFVAGLALQVASMSLFLLLWFDFLYNVFVKLGKDAQNLNCTREELYNPEYAHLRQGKLFKYFTILLTVLVLFIFTRCVYRVCELAEGWTGFLILHEDYFIALDAVMISLATCVFVPFFPGFVFDGRHTKIPVKKGGKLGKRKNHHDKMEDTPDTMMMNNNDYENSISDSKIYNPSFNLKNDQDQNQNTYNEKKFDKAKNYFRNIF